MIFLIEDEFRSSLRNSFEKLLYYYFEKKLNKKQTLLFKISIRAISSLIAVYLVSLLSKTQFKNLTINYTSILLISIFIYYISLSSSHPL